MWSVCAISGFLDAHLGGSLFVRGVGLLCLHFGLEHIKVVVLWIFRVGTDLNISWVVLWYGLWNAVFVGRYGRFGGPLEWVICFS